MTSSLSGGGFRFLRRLQTALLTFFGVTLVVFALMRLAPGDPGEMRFSDAEIGGAELAESQARFAAEHLLDAPLWKQYLHFLGPLSAAPDGARILGGSGADPWHGLLALDPGHEFQRPQVAVRDELLARLWISAQLGLPALLLASWLGIVLGLFAARRRGELAERGLSLSLLVLDALPSFWVALLLVVLLGAGGLGWLPVLGLESADPAQRGWVDALLHRILPISCLVLGLVPLISRQVRASVLASSEAEFVRTARMKGLSEATIWRAHILRHAALPLVSLGALLVPGLLGGSVVVESVFGIPGLGRYALDAVLARDYPVIGALTALGALLTLAALMAGDWALTRLDPRIRHG